MAVTRQRLDHVEQRHDLGVAAGILDRVVEPRVEVAARAHDDVGSAERLDVVGADLVLVRVGVGREQPFDMDAIAAHVAREVGGLGRRGHDRDLPRVGAAVVLAAGREARRERGDQHRDEQAADTAAAQRTENSFSFSLIRRRR